MVSEEEWLVRDKICAEINKVLDYLYETGWLPPHDESGEDDCLVCKNVLVPLQEAAYIEIN